MHIASGQQTFILRTKGRQHEGELSRWSTWPGMEIDMIPSAGDPIFTIRYRIAQKYFARCISFTNWIHMYLDSETCTPTDVEAALSIVRPCYLQVCLGKRAPVLANRDRGKAG